ncbi:MAG: SOS response-associated peptidase [Myxococcales bacterium]|nr:SOS response-associated peptidase [Myxococcales bacterium]
MCGRFSLGVDPDSLMDELDWVTATPDVKRAHPELWRPRYNVAPGQLALVIGRREERPPSLAWMKWGLVPHWAKAEGRRPINARVETLRERPMFRESFLARRCLVPIDGWYEWSGEGDGRHASWLHAPDDQLLTLGAIWDRWRAPDGVVRFTFAVVTAASVGEAARLHDRMPLVVAPADRHGWLAPGPYEGSLVPDGRAVARPVGRFVNDVHHDDPTCRDEVA